MQWLFEKITNVTQQEFEEIYLGLSSSRKAHIDRLKMQEDRQRSLLAAKLVGALLATQNVAATLETDAEGKPYLKGSSLHISITHSGEGVACAISQEPVGIDLEKIKPVRLGLVGYACLPKEQAYILEGAAETEEGLLIQRPVIERFFEVWTTKEAAYKKGGQKNLLSIDTLQIEKQSIVIEDYMLTIL